MTDAPATNELLAERAKLIAANEAATGWGAAVGARLERIIEIDRQLRAAATPSAQGAGLLPDASPGNGAEKVREALVKIRDWQLRDKDNNSNVPPGFKGSPFDYLKTLANDAINAMDRQAALHSTSAAGEKRADAIKVLEWLEDDDNGRSMWRARSDIGPVYTVYDDGFSEPPYRLHLHQLHLGSFSNVGVAKAAAQLDYEQRIRAVFCYGGQNQ